MHLSLAINSLDMDWIITTSVEKIKTSNSLETVKITHRGKNLRHLRLQG